MAIEERNALITHVDFDTERGLTMWATLDYGGAAQHFGGFLLYHKKSWEDDTKNNKNFCGHFVARLMEVVGVDTFSKLVGSPCRVKAEHTKVHEIGHFLKDKWFNPTDEFARFSDDK